jgi:sugar lactone lactonase YvrE
MLKRFAMVSVVLAAFVLGYLVSARQAAVEGQAAPGAGFAAVPGAVGAMDLTGPYDVVKGWPKDLSTLPGNEKWTWGAGEGVFAESPNRVIIVERGELPVLSKIKETPLPQIAPSLSFPVMDLVRNDTQASPPGALEINGKVGDDSDKGKNGVDFNWQNCLVVADADGNITERWTQWDKILRRPHSAFISPYDPQKNVWIVDDYRQAIFKFTNDGKTLLQTLGVPNVHASDDKHFYRPTFMAWQPDGSFYVADGYANTRVVKFDKDGKYLTAWGEKGEAGGKEMRPNYFNNVHGVAIDPQTREVYINDRGNHRIQIFDENGKFLRQWKINSEPSNIHFVYIGTDRKAWVFDNSTQKLAQYDLNGHLLYSWGSLGTFPGALWGAHGISVDQEGNLYLAMVGYGGVQKFHPRAGANPNFLVGKPIKAAW